MGKIVITEGVTDLYLLDLVKRFSLLLSNDIRIIPGAGSGNLSNLISIGLSFSENFVVLFDNDAGAKAITKYKSEFGDEIQRYFHLYSSQAGFALEDFFSAKDKQKILEIAETKILKRALVFFTMIAMKKFKGILLRTYHQKL